MTMEEALCPPGVLMIESEGITEAELEAATRELEAAEGAPPAGVGVGVAGQIEAPGAAVAMRIQEGHA